MKHHFCVCWFFLLGLFYSFSGMSQVRFSATQSLVGDSLLRISVFGKNASSNIRLGSCNFSFMMNEKALKISNAYIETTGSKFTAKVNPKAYEHPTLGQRDQMVNLSILQNTSDKSPGVLIQDAPIWIGDILIPIQDPCATSQLVWNVQPMALHDDQMQNIKSNAVFESPAQSFLLNKFLPLPDTFSLVKVGSTLVSPYSGGQWYLDQKSISGATDPILPISSSGSYQYKVGNICKVVASTSFGITITSLKEQEVSNFALQVFPNPFSSKASVQYQITSSADVRLELYNLQGIKQSDLINERKNAGKYTFNIESSKLNLVAGTYILRITVDKKVNSLALVYLQ